MTTLGAWQLLPDPAERGIDEGWFAAIAPGARPAPVPGVIQQVFPEALGVAWYWARVEVAPDVPAGHRRWLRFGAVDYRATVWVDGNHVGGHENGETPFELDVTDALAASGPHLVAVRVVAPGEDPADGLDLEHIPHRNKRSRDYHPGWLHAHGGILLPVELVAEPPVRIVDLHARTDASTGEVVAWVRLAIAAGGVVDHQLVVTIGPDLSGAITDRSVMVVRGMPRDEIEVCLSVDEPRPWDLDDPFLYRVEATIARAGDPRGTDVHRRSVRVGFRELRVEAGYFRLNGRRILLRSSHTGNHFPIGQIVPPTKDMLRRDFLNAKAAGFNMIRFMSGVAWPEQLDLCDEIGLMIYEEPMGAWLLKDSPEMLERYDRSLREMIVRDRNHPCVTVWGLLTETLDGRLFRHAVDSLGAVRELDPTRLVMLNSGRFDAQPGIGSLANPGSSSWEHVWGHEAPDAPGRTLAPDPATGWLTPDSWIGGDLSLAGSIEGNGDTHTYPLVPHAPSAVAFLRSLGEGTRPHMLSEYGIGSLMNVIGETRDFEQAGARPDLLDAALIRSMAERFEADFDRFDLGEIYPFPEDLLLDAQRQHARYRAQGFDAVRSNPNIPGFNVTGLLDHALTGEGFWTFWRRWKPGAFDVLTDGWAPLRWCLFSDTMHAYPGRPLRLEAVIANEDVLSPGTYLARFRLAGPSGTCWGEDRAVVIAGTGSGSGALAVPVLDVTIAAPTEPGRYVFAAELASGGRPAGGRVHLRVADPLVAPPEGTRVSAAGLHGDSHRWLASLGVDIEPVEAGSRVGSADMIIVGGGTLLPDPHSMWREVLGRVEAGATAIVLSPAAARSEGQVLDRLPTALQGRSAPFYDWVYHREWVRTRHPMFAGLPGPGLMDWDDYGPLLGGEMLHDMPAPSELAAVAFAVGYSTPGGYASGIVAGTWQHGRGRLFLTTLHVESLLGRHPAADRILLNLLQWASAAAPSGEAA